MCHCGLLPIICHLFKLEEEEKEERGVYPSVPCVVHACLVIRIALPLPLSLEVVSLFTLDAAALSTKTIRMTDARSRGAAAAAAGGGGGGKDKKHRYPKCTSLTKQRRGGRAPGRTSAGRARLLLMRTAVIPRWLSSRVRVRETGHWGAPGRATGTRLRSDLADPGSLWR